MSAAYRVLRVALALEKFTVEQLATFAGVPKPTVYTVIDRHPQFIQHAGVLQTGRPGGQHKLYTIPPNQRNEVADKLRELVPTPFLDHDASSNFDTEHSPASEPPVALIAAEAELDRFLFTASEDGHAPTLEDVAFYVELAADDLLASSAINDRGASTLAERISILKGRLQALRDNPDAVPVRVLSESDILAPLLNWTTDLYTENICMPEFIARDFSELINNITLPSWLHRAADGTFSPISCPPGSWPIARLVVSLWHVISNDDRKALVSQYDAYIASHFTSFNEKLFAEMSIICGYISADSSGCLLMGQLIAHNAHACTEDLAVALSALAYMVHPARGPSDQRMVGLLYTLLSTRPDLAFSVPALLAAACGSNITGWLGFLMRAAAQTNLCEAGALHRCLTNFTPLLEDATSLKAFSKGLRKLAMPFGPEILQHAKAALGLRINDITAQNISVCRGTEEVRVTIHEAHAAATDILRHSEFHDNRSVTKNKILEPIFATT